MAEQDDLKTARETIRRALDVMEEREEELHELDAAIGDGDHGAGMVRGFRAAVEQLGSADSVSETYIQAGRAFQDAAGGASGALYGQFIMTVGRALPDSAMDSADAHQALDQAMEMLQQMGGAEPGDKTMLDTLDPFIEALEEEASRGRSLPDAWQQALPAAREGAESTREMVSQKGRSSKLGERSQGHLDPGAMSLFYLLESTGEVLEQRC